MTVSAGVGANSRVTAVTINGSGVPRPHGNVPNATPYLANASCHVHYSTSFLSLDLEKKREMSRRRTCGREKISGLTTST